MAVFQSVTCEGAQSLSFSGAGWWFVLIINHWAFSNMKCCKCSICRSHKVIAGLQCSEDIEWSQMSVTWDPHCEPLDSEPHLIQVYTWSAVEIGLKGMPRLSSAVGIGMCGWDLQSSCISSAASKWAEGEVHGELLCSVLNKAIRIIIILDSSWCFTSKCHKVQIWHLAVNWWGNNPTSAWCFVGCRSSCVLLVSVALLFILATKIKRLQEQTIRITTTQKLKQKLYFLVVVDSWAIPGKEVIRDSFLGKIHSSASEKTVFPTAFLSVQ